MNFINNFQLCKSLWYFRLYYYLLYRRGNKHFDVHLRRITPVHFLSEDGKSPAYGGKMLEMCVFPARVGILSL